MRGNPGGDPAGHQPAQGEVFASEDGQGNSVEKAAEGYELIEAPSLQNFAFQYHRKADGEESQAKEVRPEDGCGD